METLYHQVCSSLLCLRPSAHREPALHLQSSPFSLVIPLPLRMLLPQGGVKGTQRAQTKQDMLSNAVCGGRISGCLLSGSAWESTPFGPSCSFSTCVSWSFWISSWAGEPLGALYMWMSCKVFLRLQGTCVTDMCRKHPLLQRRGIHCNAMYCYEANPSPGLGQYDDGPCEKNERESR